MGLREIGHEVENRSVSGNEAVITFSKHGVEH
jgi:hypothetical protein